jgi:tetratricopeptide (TPR) repeat protein
MSKQVCLTCGTSYEGWSCPSCAVKKEIKRQTEEMRRIHEDHREQYRREQEKNREVIEEASFRAEQAAWDAAEEHREAVAQSWMIQAESKTKRAFDLYKARMYEEAVSLARQAIQQDPGNISAYMCAAWALEACGAGADARRYYQKQVDLLRAPDNRQSGVPALLVLTGLPHDDDLVRTFSDILLENSGYWVVSSETIQLLSGLIDRGLREHARFLLESALSKSNALSLGTDWLSLGDTLIDHGLFSDARFLMETLAAKTNRLLPHAYLVEISDRSSETRTDSCTTLLQGTPFDQRLAVAEDLKAVASGDHRFSPSTVARLKELVSARYEQWGPAIARAEREAAVKVADNDSRIEEYGKSARLMGPKKLGFLTWLGAWAGGLFVTSQLVASTQQFVTAGSPRWVFLSWAILAGDRYSLCFVGGIVLGVISAKARRKRIMNEIVKVITGNSERRELDLWAPLIGSRSS